MAGLFDVNALIALIDPDHVDHAAMQTWFAANYRAGWVTCPLTENGAVRVLSQPSYAGGQRRPYEVIHVIRALKTKFAQSYEFWPDSLSIADGTLFDEAMVAGSSQVTDAYLAGLALRHGGKLVTFDRSIAWQTLHGGSAKLVVHPRD